jgi:hypothetical protein
VWLLIGNHTDETGEAKKAKRAIGNKLRDKQFAWCYDSRAFAIRRPFRFLLGCPASNKRLAKSRQKAGERPDHVVIAKKNEKTGC